MCPGIFHRQTGDSIITARRELKPGGETVERNLNAGENPPDGVLVYYFLKQKPEGEVKLTFLDAQGEQIKSFTSEQAQRQSPKAEDAPPEAPDEEEDREKKDPRVHKEAGMNRFLWNARYPDQKTVDGYVASEAVMAGPVAAPGIYHVQLTVADQTLTEAFEVQKDPRVPATQEHLGSQFKLLLKVRDKLSETHAAINTPRNIRQQWDGS